MHTEELTKKATTKAFKNYINGEWIENVNGNHFEQRDPADLNVVTGIWPSLSTEETTRAIDAAANAFPSWSRLTYYERAGYLKKALEAMINHQEEIIRTITIENGKTLAESKTEVISAIKEMEFQIHEGLRTGGKTIPSEHAGVMAYTTRQPLGVIAAITPWNFPFNVLGRKITPALMAGNTVVFKPASLTPQTGLRFMELFIKAGLPHGVLNFVTGSGSEVGETMVSDPRVKAISFTGSTEVGVHIHQKASARMTRTQLEMGGKNPLVVLSDCDMEKAAEAAVIAAFACAGQWCTSTSRVIVEEKISDQFIAMLQEKTARMKLGNGLTAETTMGPVCGQSQLKSILNYIETGKKEGAHLLTGGYQVMDGDFESGCFIAPTIFVDVSPEMKIAQEEIFGPVLSVITVKDLNEAIQVANDVEFGLCSSIYTRDLDKAYRFIQETEVGFTHVNLITALKEPQFTFGGIKNSGFGIPEAGQTGIEFFTEHKVVYIKHN